MSDQPTNAKNNILDAVPFNSPAVAPNSERYVAESLASRRLSGDGDFTARASKILSALHNGSTALLTTSGTAALEIMALLWRLEPGDEVIVPSFTFVTGASAFAARGATLVFADIDDATLNLDLDEVRSLITERTRLIVPVNYAGRPSIDASFVAEMTDLGISVVEDNAHGLFATASDSTPLGTFGAASALSFHETKNVSCGEGGAVILNDPELVERAEIIREKGTNRSNFFRGLADKYTWIEVGSSYLMSDIHAALLLAQLEQVEQTQRQRGDAWRRYSRQLAPWAREWNVRLPPEIIGASHHMFELIMPTSEARDSFIAHMRELKITAPFHYLPLHLSPAGERYGHAPSQCPRTVDISSRLVRLPLYADLDPARQLRVIEECARFAELGGFDIENVAYPSAIDRASLNPS